MCLMTSSMKSSLLVTLIITMERDVSHGSYMSLSSFEPVTELNNFKKELCLKKRTIILNASIS